MLSRILITMITILTVSGNLHAGFLDSMSGWFSHSNRNLKPTIKVLIVHDQPGVLLDLQGKYKIYDPNTNSLISMRTLGKRRVIEAKPDGLRWGEEFPGVHQLKIVPENGLGRVIIDGIEYLGAIYVYDVGGSISVVNELGIENYLNGILTPQFPDPLPEELLAAISIAARTNAIYEAEHPKTKFWSVDARVVGYHGAVKAKKGSRIQEAIRVTQDMVLSRTGTYEGVITPFPAQWGSKTGGKQNRTNAVFSRISLFQAEELANEGKHAAEVLARAFPNSHIELTR